VKQNYDARLVSEVPGRFLCDEVHALEQVRDLVLHRDGHLERKARGLRNELAKFGAGDEIVDLVRPGNIEQPVGKHLSERGIL
jgi:hypothetical protein